MGTLNPTHSLTHRRDVVVDVVVVIDIIIIINVTDFIEDATFCMFTII